ncbi:S41 family peptidase [uncultured Fibrobacter sp.]|uniref:S41 family peptidase n=1 Tax=uncultured Fibrobacter sp. TaxID=261512 RepID=UPI0025FA2EE8|nr:PDZ domain-containing protein [uncultured Fibrobacter sp.]
MKSKFGLLVLGSALAASPLLASESFGGIGVSIYQVRDGVKVAEVIPGTPAAETKLQANDVIIAVDGESLKGKSIEESKAKLRGQKNKPLEITFVSGVDTLSVTLRRTQITVKDLESEHVESWYGDKSEFNAQELETYVL